MQLCKFRRQTLCTTSVCLLLLLAKEVCARLHTATAQHSGSLVRVPIQKPAALQPYYAAASANVSEFRTSLYGRVLRYYSDELIRQYPDAAVDRHALKFGNVEPKGSARFDAWQTSISCPSGQQLKRYGKDGDGGKWLCPLDTLTAPCTIMSLGSNYDTTFEHSMLTHTPCNVHTFDCTVDLPSMQHPRHFFHKKCIGLPNGAREGYEGYYLTIDKAAAATGTADIVLLKCDIELYEHALLSGWAENTTGLPQQISMELHYNAAVSLSTVAEYVAGKDLVMRSRAQLTFGELSLLAAHVSNLGYGVVSREDNPLCPACTELTLYRVETFVPTPKGLEAHI